MVSIGIKAVELAAQSIGVMEDPPGSNWGKYVQAYLNSVGINSPAAWCAAFVNYKVKQAAMELKVASDWPATGYCPTILAWAKQNKRLLAKPVPGAVFLVKRNIFGGARHTGFVKSVSPDGSYIISVEGNSNDNGSAEGVGVYSNKRPVNWKLIFVAPDRI